MQILEGLYTLMTFEALVVEDEPALHALYKTILNGMGFQVLAANNGQEAIDILSATTPTLIFLDIRLPLVNGIHVIDYMESEARFAQTHVVIVSSSQEFASQANRLPSAEFLLKPILPDDIRRVGGHFI